MYLANGGIVAQLRPECDLETSDPKLQGTLIPCCSDRMPSPRIAPVS